MKKLFKVLPHFLILLVMVTIVQGKENNSKAVPVETAALESEADTSELYISDKAPPIVLRDIFGRLVNIKNIIGKKNIIVAFWATYCIPCREEMPQLERLAKKYDDDVSLLLVSVDKRKKGLVSGYIRRHGIRSIVLLDVYKQTLERYKVDKIPALFLIDKSGEIVFKSSGYRSTRGVRELRKILEILIAYKNGASDDCYSTKTKGLKTRKSK
ncbi:MAG: TlpA family protein disulfide reductase [Fibrobacteria bacterium]|nr:TlpA family protein disulfide reductase [Fibrobacteria bacterium]